MSQSDRPRILIVDDEEAILETMTFTFMDLYDVLTTSDPMKAISILEENDPVAVVITDQRMPGMTGVDLLKEVYARCITAEMQEILVEENPELCRGDAEEIVSEWFLRDERRDH